MLNELLNILDRLSLEDNLYWSTLCPTDSKHEKVEVWWERKNKPTPWRIKTAHHDQVYRSDDLEAAFSQLSIDQLAFEQKLSINILSQAVYADTLIQNVREVLGNDVVDRSIVATQTFLNTIKLHAAKLSDKPIRTPQAQLRLLK